MSVIRLDLGDGPEVWIETVTVEGSPSMGYTGDRGPARERLESLAPEEVAGAVSALVGRLGPSAVGDAAPREVTMKFGLAVDAHGRLLVAASGSIEVTARWKLDRDD